ncbi:MAG: hypothetical protein ACLGHY_08350, partial [Gammaproteobacteria bacterium]
MREKQQRDEVDAIKAAPVKEGRLLRHGGVIVVDHALLGDRIADPGQNDEETESVRAALELIRDNEDLVPTL